MADSVDHPYLPDPPGPVDVPTSHGADANDTPPRSTISPDRLCPICLDTPHNGPVWGRDTLTPRPVEGGSSCAHKFCMGCARDYIQHAIKDAVTLGTTRNFSDSHTGIKCPGPKCTYILNGADIVRHVGKKAYASLQLAAHKSRRTLHEAHNRTMRMNPMFRAYFLDAMPQPCPDCNVLVERNLGCNHMSCVCGASFCYNCGGPLNGGHICSSNYCIRCSRYGHTTASCTTPHCGRCRDFGHEKRDCTYVHIPRCTRCQKEGHVARACAEVQCSKCQRVGHSSAMCTATTCQRCSAVGHTARKCPAPYCTACRTYGHTLDSCDVSGYANIESEEGDCVVLRMPYPRDVFMWPLDVLGTVYDNPVDCADGDKVSTADDDRAVSDSLSLSCFLPPSIYGLASTDRSDSSSSEDEGFTSSGVEDVHVSNGIIDPRARVDNHSCYTDRHAPSGLDASWPELAMGLRDPGPAPAAAQRAALKSSSGSPFRIPSPRVASPTNTTRSNVMPTMTQAPGVNTLDVEARTSPTVPAARSYIVGQDDHHLDPFEVAAAKHTTAIRVAVAEKKEKCNSATQQRMQKRREQSARDRAAQAAKAVAMISSQSDDRDSRSNKRSARREGMTTAFVSVRFIEAGGWC